MGTTLGQFADECRDILKKDSGPGGLEQIRRRLEGILADEAFIDAHLGPDADSPRKILYQDPELGFCILAHVYKGAKHSGPHDHGPSWAIYGQAKGITEMTEYRKVEPPQDGRPGKAEAVKTYALKPGMAAAYAVGQLHAPKRDDETRLIRIEGMNMDNVKRDAYEEV